MSLWQSHFGCRRMHLFYLAKFKKREENTLDWSTSGLLSHGFIFFPFIFFYEGQNAGRCLFMGEKPLRCCLEIKSTRFCMLQRRLLLFKSLSILLKKRHYQNLQNGAMKFFCFVFLKTNSVLEEIFYYLIHNTFVLFVIKSLPRVLMPATTFKRAAI